MKKTIIMGLLLGIFATIAIITSIAVSETFAQPGNRAQNEIIPIMETTATDFCPGGEIVLISGNAHITSQLILRGEDEAVYHIVQHLNLQNVRGVGQTTGDQYIFQNAANNVFNHQITSDGVIHGSDTSNTANVQLISPGHSLPDLNVHFLVHATVNANGEVTTEISNFDARCR
jgi:hypothetical protein